MRSWAAVVAIATLLGCSARREAASVEVPPSNIPIQSGSVAPFEPRPELRYTRAIGFVINKGDEGSQVRLAQDGQEWAIADGKIEIAKGLGIRPSRHRPRIDSFVIPRDMDMVQVRHLPLQSLRSDGEPMLIDILGVRHRAVGSTYLDAQTTRVRYTPDRPLKTLAEGFPAHPDLREVRLNLVFLVPRNTPIREAQVGDVILERMLFYDPYPVLIRGSQLGFALCKGTEGPGMSLVPHDGKLAIATGTMTLTGSNATALVTVERSIRIDHFAVPDGMEMVQIRTTGQFIPQADRASEIGRPRFRDQSGQWHEAVGFVYQGQPSGSPVRRVRYTPNQPIRDCSEVGELGGESDRGNLKFLFLVKPGINPDRFCVGDAVVYSWPAPFRVDMPTRR